MVSERDAERGAGPASAADLADASPLIRQYLAIKSAHPDELLLYRMGDFYEVFFDDAVAAAGALDITLTKRGRHQGADIAMAGVPVHALDAYLARLIRKGFKVAICEQVEDPAAAKRRGPKAIVERDVVRVVTPGTLTEDTLLESRAHNYLAALGRAEGAFALAWLDVSTGDLAVADVTVATLAAELARLEPGELLVADSLLAEPSVAEALRDWESRLSPLPAARFASRAGERRLTALYGVAALDAFGAFGRAQVAALGAVVDYVELTQRGRLPHVKPPVVQAPGATMAIDGATRRNLELARTLGGERTGSLLAAIDLTVTAGGARRLSADLAAPLTDVAAIERRLDRVALFVGDEALRSDVRAALRRCPDLERAVSRLTVGRGGPRDLAAVRTALAEAAALRRRLAALTHPAAGAVCTAWVTALGDREALAARLAAALADELPLLARDGGFVRAGFAADLDAQRALRDESRRLIAALQQRYAQETGIAGLKIRHNNVLGYFIEVTTTHAGKLGTDHAVFVHRQTLASAVRYTTVELGDLADRIARAGDRALALELAVFEDLVAEVRRHAAALADIAGALAGIDVAAALGDLAAARRYVRPRVDDSLAFDIRGGRHPVVEAALAGADAASFVANDCDLGDGRRLWLVTGPNMAGKSTFLRQNALIAILAQMGSFVPAASAHVGVIDRLFSRVGAADDLARGRSTFMVEMIETAAILNQASERSLVILDEIGRGTATFDGLSIAWATVEHLHDSNRCRALFATHFHELTALAAKLPALACHTMRVKEWRGEVVFLHEVGPGAADRSYGIQVARLAGLPAPVIARAEAVLTTLEAGRERGGLARLADDLPLFAAARAPSPSSAPPPSPVEELLAATDVDGLTPRAALDLLYRLKDRLGPGSPNGTAS